MWLEQGAGRFDVNVSIRFEEGGKTVWPPQSEIKNLNSYEALRGAVAFESDRLWQEWQAGGEIRKRTGKVTVGWSPERGRTYLQRSKEEVEDYRYFPEPDLVALEPSSATVAQIRAALPEMPAERRARFTTDYGLSEYVARNLVSDRALADYFEAAAKVEPTNAKQIANWIMGELTAALKRDGNDLGAMRVGAQQLAVLVRLVASGTVSGTAAKRVFSEMWKNGGDPEAIVNSLGLAQTSDEEAIAAAVDEIITANPNGIAAYRPGNMRALDGLTGPVMGRFKGNAADRGLGEGRSAEDRSDHGVAEDRRDEGPEPQAPAASPNKRHEDRHEAQVPDRRARDARDDVTREELRGGDVSGVAREVGLRRWLVADRPEEEQDRPDRTRPDEPARDAVGGFVCGPNRCISLVRSRRIILAPSTSSSTFESTAVITGALAERSSSPCSHAEGAPVRASARSRCRCLPGDQ